jgi:ribonuclease D
MVITRPSDLEALARRLRDHGAFALDMEFQRERSYWPKLQLIQVGLPDEAAAVDPLAIQDLSPLFDLIADPALEKITHAGRQDAEIFFARAGRPPANLYDTQIAAALVGYGEQVGYGTLVTRLLGVRLEKKERITDWGHRPLSPAQLDYALDDVRYLIPMRDRLNEELEGRHRRDWLREELAFYEDPGLYTQDPSRLFMKISRWRSLNRRGLGVLRELAIWREEVAAHRDLPRPRVAADDVLVEIALRKPQVPDDLKPLRRLHPKDLERYGEAMVAAVQRGLQVPDTELPNPPKPPRDDPEVALVVDLLGVFLRQRARQEKIAPSYLGNQRELTALVEWLRSPHRGDPPPLFQGWRRRVAGDGLVDLYEGKTRLRVDRQTGAVVAEPADSDGSG